MSYGPPPGPNQPDPQQPTPGAPAVPPVPQQPGAAPSYGAPTNQPPAASPYGAPAYGGQAGYGGGPWGGAPQPRPGSVTGGAVMAIIGSALMLIFGVIFLGLAGNPHVLHEAGLPSEYTSMLGAIGGAMLVVGLLVVVFAALALKGKFWAVIGLTVIGGIYLLLSIASLLQGQAQVLIGAIYVGISTGLLLSPQSRAWYASKR